MPGQVSRILTRIWGKRTGYVFLPRKAGNFWLEEVGTYPYDGTLPDITVPATQNVYFAPLVFSRPKRLSEYALPTAVLWSDLDYADPSKMALRPSVAWRTTQGGSPDTDRYQALWLLDREVTPQAAAELSRRIAYAEGADKSGWDVTQVLRLPGTYNHKHDPPQRIELLWAKDLTYDPRRVALVYPNLPVTNGHAELEWPKLTEHTVQKHLAALPMGVRYMLERSAGGADRSFELLKLAKLLIRQFQVPRDVALHLLERSALAQSKYEGRRDGRKQLLQLVENATTVVSK